MTSQQRRIALLQAVVAACVIILSCAASHAQSEDFTFTHKVAYDTYLPGAPVDITVTFDYPGNLELTALALVETLPAGWHFDSLITTDSAPAIADLPLGLQFTWLSIPAFPFSFRYRVLSDPGASGDQTITGFAPFRLDAQELAAGPAAYKVHEAAFSLTTSTAGTGDIFPAPGTIHLSSPQLFTIEAIATEADSVFSGWGGDFFGALNPMEILVDRDRNVVANFSQTFSLTVEQQGTGTVGPPPGEYRYQDRTEVTVAAVAEPGQIFIGWEGDLGGNGPSEQITMDRDKLVRAIFVPAISFTMVQVGEGTVSPAPGVYQHPAATQLQLTAEAAPGWRFTGWEGGAAGANSPVNVTLFSGLSTTAVFTQEHHVHVSIVGGGRTFPPPGGYTVLNGENFEVQALTSSLHPFLRWDGSVGSLGSTLSLAVEDSLELVAVFGGASEGEFEGGSIEGEAEGGFEGEPGAEGEVEGEEASSYSSADQDQDYQVSLSELLRVVQFYNAGGFACEEPSVDTEDGFQPGAGGTGCTPYSADYDPRDWDINLSELLRIIQVFNSLGYEDCPHEADGICPIPKPGA